MKKKIQIPLTYRFKKEKLPETFSCLFSCSECLSFLSCSEPRWHHMQLCWSSLCGVFICGLLLCSLHRNTTGVCSDLSGAASARPTHSPTAQTWAAHTRICWWRRNTQAEEGDLFDDFASKLTWLGSWRCFASSPKAFFSSDHLDHYPAKVSETHIFKIWVQLFQKWRSLLEKRRWTVLKNQIKSSCLQRSSFTELDK